MIWREKIKYKTNTLTLQIFLNLQTPPYNPIKGEVGQLSKKKRVLCWFIYIISLNPANKRVNTEN